jgi:hypothetical protein
MQHSVPHALSLNAQQYQSNDTCKLLYQSFCNHPEKHCINTEICNLKVDTSASTIHHIHPTQLNHTVHGADGLTFGAPTQL